MTRKPLLAVLAVAALAGCSAPSDFENAAGRVAAFTCGYDSTLDPAHGHLYWQADVTNLADQPTWLTVHVVPVDTYGRAVAGDSSGAASAQVAAGATVTLGNRVNVTTTRTAVGCRVVDVTASVPG